MTDTDPKSPAPSVDSGSAPPARGYLLLVGLILFWGLNFPAMKVILSHMDAWTFRTLCLIIGGLGLLAICRANGMCLAVPRSDRGNLMLTALFFITGWHLFSAFGIGLMQAGRAMILGYTMPLWASLLGVVDSGREALRPQGARPGFWAWAAYWCFCGPTGPLFCKLPRAWVSCFLAAWCWAVGHGAHKTRALARIPGFGGRLDVSAGRDFRW